MTRLRRLCIFVLERPVLLPAGATLGLAWANLWPASYGRVSHALQFAVNDVAMVFFFALAAKEIVEATADGGALHSPREAAVPLLAAAAGMAVPAVLFALAATAAGRPELLRGWAIPCATDIAFSYLVARVVFSPHHPAIPFLLLLAVADDALGLVILALFYPADVVSPLRFAALMIPAIGAAWWLRTRRVPHVWPYVVGCGGLSWAALFLGGLHPALALVPIVPFMHVESKYHELFEETSPWRADTLNVFAEALRVPVQAILFFFGLVNAGVPLGSVGAATWMVAGALVVGKPLGILAMTRVAVAAGLRRPPGMTYGDVTIVGIAAGIGFTVALFFATAAFPPGRLLDEMKLGALFSLAAAPLAVACSRHRTRRRRPA